MVIVFCIIMILKVFYGFKNLVNFFLIIFFILKISLIYLCELVVLCLNIGDVLNVYENMFIIINVYKIFLNLVILSRYLYILYIRRIVSDFFEDFCEEEFFRN